MATQSPPSPSDPSSFSPSLSASTSRKRKRAGTQAQPTTREYGFMRDTGEHDSARFVGSSSGIHFIRNVHMRLARRSANRNHYGNHTQAGRGGERLGELVPGEDDQLRRKSAQRNDESTQLWKEHEIAVDDAPTPTFDQLVEWSESYFESWHPILPFLHGPDVLQIFEDVSKNGLSSLHHLDRSILRSILSISLADSRQRKPLTQAIPSCLLFRTVDEAVACSQFALCEPASIRATQAAISIQLFLISMLCLNAASRLGGLIVRMAFHLGLHRCPTRYPFFTAEEASRRRRVFWCLYCCERFLSQSLGLPLDIRDDDVDVCYPGEEQHGIASAADGADKRLQLLVFMTKHARIRGLILELRNKSIAVRQDTAEQAVAVQTELAKWSNEIQDTVEEAEINDSVDDNGETGISMSHRLVLLLSKYESTISLNRPMMASDPSTPLWSAAMQACISAAKSICITMRKHIALNKRSGDGSDRTLISPMLWPSFIWVAWISAFVLAFAAFEQQMPLESALRHIESSKDALRHIAARDTSWPEYCLSAIDELTSAVRELSHEHSDEDPPGVAFAGSEAEDASRSAGRMTRSQARGPSSTPTTRLSHQNLDDTQDLGRQTGSPVVVSSYGVGNTLAGQLPPSEMMQRRPPEWSRDSASYLGSVRSGINNMGGQIQASGSWPHRVEAADVGTVPFPTTVPYQPPDLGTTPIPGEGQESMMWYDQLFDGSFGAIDNPFLAAAQLDNSIDPTYSYLR